MKIRFLGHAAIELTDGEHVVLIDPFLTGNPKAPVGADEFNPNTILISHGHADHVGDAVEIAKRTNSPVVAITELAAELAQEGIETFNPNIGGTIEFDWGSVKLVPAWHTMGTPKGGYATPSGLIVKFGGKTIYHLGDTGLFSDLELIGKRYQVDVALIPIGGHFTMDVQDASYAAGLIAPKVAIPIHYNTFPVIEADPTEFKSEVESSTKSKVVILEPGESYEVN